MPRHLVLLGGIGGDSHSVGLHILRHALTKNGYDVCFLSIHNRVDRFFEFAHLVNVVMISTMDGHAGRYLREFSERRRARPTPGTLWYVGGNLTIGDALGVERQFLDLGFDRAFVKFTDVRTVLSVLERDLNGVEPKDYRALARSMRPPALDAKPVTDGLLEPDVFARTRTSVLEHWHTGHDARDLEENAAFLRKQPSLARLQAEVNERRATTLVQPRSGVGSPQKQLRIFTTLRDVGARVLSYQVDSLTRNNDYAAVDEALREARETGISTLNGFPVVNHGPHRLRRIIGGAKVPLQTRHSTRDPRLLAEISYAGGVSAYEGGAICYDIPYYKDYPLDEAIRNWQYVDRLTGLYHERFGIVLDREFFGTLTATLIPPCLAIATDILESMLAVQQGVKSLSLGYAEQGHRAQDIAAIRTLDAMAREILGNMGYRDVQVNTVFNQYMAAFPPDAKRSEELIYESGITGRLAGATRIISKTPAEASRIPTLADNAHGLTLGLRGVGAAEASMIDEAAVEREASLIRREVSAILDSVLMCGNGSVAEGIVRAFREGLLDVPFSPSIYNRGLVMTARDCEGAVRFAATGNLALGAELKEIHRDKMQDRRRAEGLLTEEQDYLLVEKDVLRVARGEYERWPLKP